MKFHTAIVSFFFLLISLPAWSLQYQALEPGLEYAVFSVPGNSQVKLHLLKVDLKNYRIQPIEAREFKAKSMTVKEMAEKTKALAVINANFFDKDKKPLGLVLKEGRIKNRFHPTYWWASLLIKGPKARIAKVFKSSEVKGYQSGVQAGPRLVISGKAPRLKNKSSPKSAVGIDPAGNLIIIASEGSLPIQELAKILAKPEAKGGIGLRNALNLDGGSSTQLYIKFSEFELSLPSLTKVPVGLGVFRKEKR